MDSSGVTDCSHVMSYFEQCGPVMSYDQIEDASHVRKTRRWNVQDLNRRHTKLNAFTAIIMASVRISDIWNKCDTDRITMHNSTAHPTWFAWGFTCEVRAGSRSLDPLCSQKNWIITYPLHRFELIFIPASYSRPQSDFTALHYEVEFFFSCLIKYMTLLDMPITVLECEDIMQTERILQWD